MNKDPKLAPLLTYGDMNGGRGGGKTHRLLMKVLEQALLGYPCVLIMGQAHEFGWVVSKLNDIHSNIQWIGNDMGRLGPDRGFIKLVTPEARDFACPGTLRGYPHDTRYFWDHAAIEQVLRNYLARK